MMLEELTITEQMLNETMERYDDLFDEAGRLREDYDALTEDYKRILAENTRLDNALLATSNELTDATNQINELNEENNLLHDALTKLQARYDETEASSFQHLRENEQMRVALECTYNWAMTDETEPNGGFDIFAEEIIPMIGKVLGRE